MKTVAFPCARAPAAHHKKVITWPAAHPKHCFCVGVNVIALNAKLENVAFPRIRAPAVQPRRAAARRTAQESAGDAKAAPDSPGQPRRAQESPGVIPWPAARPKHCFCIDVNDIALNEKTGNCCFFLHQSAGRSAQESHNMARRWPKTLFLR